MDIFTRITLILPLILLIASSIMTFDRSLAGATVYFKASFDSYLHNFRLWFKTLKAQTIGPYIDKTNKYKGAGSLCFRVWCRKGCEYASFKSPTFRMSMAELRKYRYITFWMMTRGLGKVRVVVWIRGKSAADKNIPFHEAGVCIQVYEAFGTTNWRYYVINIHDIIDKWDAHENVNEWYVEWYAYAMNVKGITIWVDEFLVTSEAFIKTAKKIRVKTNYKVFISASNSPTLNSIVRVAIYVLNKDKLPIYEFKIRLGEAYGVELIKVENKMTSRIDPGKYGKYILFLKIKSRMAKFTLIANYGWSQFMINEVVGTYEIDDPFIGPLIKVKKEVNLISPYEALVRIVVKNIGDKDALYIRVADLIPKGLYIVSGSTKAWIKRLKPNEKYSYEYVLMSFYDGKFILPEARVIYYDDKFNEYWAWSNKVTVILKKAPKGYSGVLKRYELRIFPERPSVNDIIYVVKNFDKHRILAISLQGIINKYKPCIYLVYGRNEEIWLKELVLQYGIAFKEVSLEELILKFKDHIKGYIVYDDELPETINIATILASIHDSIIVSPKEEDFAKQFGLKKVEDLRSKWKNREEMYEWLIKYLLPMTNNRVIAFLHVRVPPPGWTNRFDLELRDYLISTQSLVITMSPRYDGIPYTSYDWVLLEEIYDRYLPPVVIMGWWYDEGANVARLSERGFSIVATDLVPNLSLLSALKPLHPLIQPHPHYEHLDKSGVYITMLRSDGDNFCVNYGFMTGKHGGAWLDSRRGMVPYGWSIQPLGYELTPIVLQYIYQTMTSNDYLFAGPSGAGYYFPSCVKTNFRYIKYAIDQYYCKLADTPLYQVLGNPEYLLQILTTDYIQYCGAKYIQHGYNKEPLAHQGRAYYIDGVCYMYTGVDLFQGESWVDVVKEVDNFVKSTRKRPLFIIIHTINWFTSYDDVIKLYQELSKKGYHVVHPEQFYELFKLACLKRLFGEIHRAKTYKAYYPHMCGICKIKILNKEFTLRKKIAIFIKTLFNYSSEVNKEVYNHIREEVVRVLNKRSFEVELNKLMRYVLILKSAKKLNETTKGKLAKVFEKLQKMFLKGNYKELEAEAEISLVRYANITLSSSSSNSNIEKPLNNDVSIILLIVLLLSLFTSILALKRFIK